MTVKLPSGDVLRSGKRVLELVQSLHGRIMLRAQRKYDKQRRMDHVRGIETHQPTLFARKKVTQNQ